MTLKPPKVTDEIPATSSPLRLIILPSSTAAGSGEGTTTSQIMTQNIKVPPFLPTVPLPMGVVSGGMMYMYSCSQCDFKTHIEAMFKQHVDSVHLGITNAASNIILSNNVIATATTGAVAVNPVAVTATIAGQQVPQTVMMATAAPGSVASLAGVNKSGLVTVAAAPGVGATTGITTVHKCPKCGFLAPSKNQLTQHRKKFHGKTALQSFSTATVTGQVVASAAAATATGTNLSGKKTYTCSTCGYSTTRRDGLSQHYDSVHLKIKNHQCALCPYAASQKGTLNRHVKLRHKKKDELILPKDEVLSTATATSLL